MVQISCRGQKKQKARDAARKARALGMSRTVYRNASGLPDTQLTVEFGAGAGDVAGHELRYARKIGQGAPVGDADLLEKGETAVMSIRNFGEKSLDELRQKMREKGFLKDQPNNAE